MNRIDVVSLYEAVRLLRLRSMPARFGAAALGGLLIWTLFGSSRGPFDLYRLLQGWGKTNSAFTIG